MYLSYGLIRNPCYFRVFEYISYHSSAYYMNSYKDLIRRRYIKFTPLSTCTVFLCLGFTLHMISTKPPSIFNRMNLSSSMLALRYAPGTSKILTSLPSCASMIRLKKKIPGKWLARMRLLWLCSISGVAHLCTSSLLVSAPFLFYQVYGPKCSFLL